MGRPPVLKDKVYVNFWAEREFFDAVNALAKRYYVTRSQVLRIIGDIGLKGFDAEMRRRRQGG
ncbi:MAG: hypothetical protein ACE5IO_09405 [Thermoplasmata archaeon]